MKTVRKKLHKREIKKLKAVEIKREPFKKLDDKLKKEEPEKVKEDSEFHETILKKSMDLSAESLKTEEVEPEEPKNQERIENLEEFASTLPSPERKIEEKPYSAASAYGTGGGSGTYDSDTRYDRTEGYEAGTAFMPDRAPGLRTGFTNAFGTAVFGGPTDERGKEGLTANRLEESARLSQQSRREREATTQENAAPHQSKKREIF